MGKTRVKTVFLPLLLAAAFHESNGFGLSRGIFTRRGVSPRVQHIPIDPTSVPLSDKISTVRAANKICDADPNKRHWKSRLNPLPKLRKVIAQSRPPHIATTTGRRALLAALASALLTLVVRPTRALAMGGGMGGAKGPVAPIAR